MLLPLLLIAAGTVGLAVLLAASPIGLGWSLGVAGAMLLAEGAYAMRAGR